MDLETKQQLLNMGFSHAEASRALDATGGKSLIRATEWLLSNQAHPNPNRNPNPVSSSSFPNPNPNFIASSSSNSPPFQPRLHRFFQSLPISDQSASPPAPASKRRKISPYSSSSPDEPLSERMRPRKIDDVVGQDHLLGANSLLRSSLESDRLPSILLWGPPGAGKTSIARAISNSASNSYRFVCLSAVNAGVKDVRDSVEESRRMKKMNKRTVLFVDEVHRFNKSQQDSFLPVIEDGSVVFIGATTENPSFHLITPLLSRCRVLKLNPLRPDSILVVLKRAVDDSERGLERSVGGVKVVVEDEAFDFLSLNCDGDARVALNGLEIAATTALARKCDYNEKPSSSSQEQVNVVVSHNEPIDESNGLESNGGKRFSSIVVVVTLEDAKEALQCKHLAYDRDGEEHYNLISALHKSMRGSDANAAIYWLARMLEGGEEPLYIARRLIRFASEDVGLADPNALAQAVACYQACHFIGMPECNVNLAQCVAYLALAPKSVSVYRAIEVAQKVVKDSVGQNEGVPLHLRNAPTKLMKDIGYGKGYIYPPDNPSSSQSYLPPSLQGYRFLDWPTS